MHGVSAKLAKTLVCKHEYDVIFWRHKQRLYSSNNNHRPLLKTRVW